MTLARGQVLALRRNGAVMVWSVSSTHVRVVPVGGYNGPPPHRAEVRFDDPAEIASCGVSFKFPVARCHQVFEMTVASAQAAPVIGTAPVTLITRIIRAIQREAEAQAMEARLLFSERRSGFSPVLM